MTNRSLLDAYDAQLRQWIPGSPPPGYQYERVGPVLRVTGGHRGFIDTPQNLGVSGEALDALIIEQRRFFPRRSEAVEWKTRGHDEPVDLAERLMAAGFVPEDRETVLVGASDSLSGSMPLPAGVTVREVREQDDFDRIAEMESVVWGGDFGWMALDLQERVQAAPDEIVVLVAEAGGTVVSAGWLVFKPGSDFAGLWGGSTLLQWRGRGIYRALVNRRAQIAAARGVRFLQVDASDDSKPILVRLGFEQITTTTPYVWHPERAR